MGLDSCSVTLELGQGKMRWHVVRPELGALKSADYEQALRSAEQEFESPRNELVHSWCTSTGRGRILTGSSV